MSAVVNNPKCDDKTGSHSSIFWMDKNSGLKACSKHRLKFEKVRIGPFDWRFQEDLWE